MNTQPDTISTTDAALDALEKGIAPIPCYPLTKVPMVKWKRWQNELPPEGLVRLWFRDARVNVAVICTGTVTFDIDDPALLDLVIAECGDTPEKVRTPSGGIHLPFRARSGVMMHNQVKVKGWPIDVRTNGGVRLIPPSRTEDGVYEWLGEGLHRISELPVARIGWTRKRQRRQVHNVIVPLDEQDAMVRRAWAWAAHIEGAISGQRGHDKFFRFVCKMLHPAPRGFGLTVQQAMPIIETFNTQCEPEWSPREIEHKITDALKKA